jgi:hypothetical protein
MRTNESKAPMKKAELDFLVERIARHKAPPIILPMVNRELLAKTAKRLRKSKDVLLAEKCSPVKN